MIIYIKKYIVAIFISIFILQKDKIFASPKKEYTKGGIVYKLNENHKTASVMEVKDLNLKRVVIPKKIKGYTVTKIKDKAFGKPKYKKYEIILLPDSITKIGDRAFSICIELKHIKLPKNLSSIGAECFFCCANLHNITIPKNVKYIGERAFFSCISLKKINIPQNLKVLEKGLFEHCISLNGFYIHKNIEKIYHDVFDQCGINLDLNNTFVDEQNPFYKKEGNYIIDKKSNSRIINFAIQDENYKEKINLANKFYTKMQDFLEKYKNCAIEEFDDICIKFLKNISNPPKLLTKEEFEQNAPNKLILYRGVTRKEYANNFKAGKLFFGKNLINERGNGIYTTPEYRHAEIWIWSSNPDDYKVLKKYEHNDKLYEKMMYKLVPHGEILKMYLDDSTKILDNSYLREIKDLIFKLHPNHFLTAATLGDVTFTEQTIKDLNVFQNKEDLLFHNSGLLTRLLGYDVLYERETKAIIDENGTLGSEYLIVNPEILNVLKD